MRRLSPPQILALSFALTALLGSFLLSLPAAVRGEPLSFVDALFTAVSALCVTGLVVVDIGSRLSLFGQLVVLFLIQMGGLGIMSFSVVFMALLGRRLSFRDRALVREAFAPLPGVELVRLVKSVMAYTFVIEGLGVLLLFPYFRADFPFPTSLFYAIFHIVAAFNNAGFSLFRENLVSYRGDIYVNLLITSLIMLGGIGFLVMVEARDFILNRIRRRPPRPLSLHLKVVLTTTVILILLGSITFFLLERENSLRGLPVKDKFLASYFQAVTPRTAGFNTLDFGRVTEATLLFTVILMYVGASPGSTGGGIKTSTIAILLALAFSRLKGREEVHLFRRAVPLEVIERAWAIAATNLTLLILGTLGLLIIELGALPHGLGRGLIDYLFEVASALGTVGLSTGITSGLSDAGKLLITTIMYIGRLGPLTIAFALGTREMKRELRYAEERLMVG